MTDLISLVMEAAAAELLYQEAAQIDREVQRLLAEVEHATVEERRRGGFAQRFLELLKRRGEIARKALIIFEEPQLEKISLRAELAVRSSINRLHNRLPRQSSVWHRQSVAAVTTSHCISSNNGQSPSLFATERVDAQKVACADLVPRPAGPSKVFAVRE